MRKTTGEEILRSQSRGLWNFISLVREVLGSIMAHAMDIPGQDHRSESLEAMGCELGWRAGKKFPGASAQFPADIIISKTSTEQFTVSGIPDIKYTAENISRDTKRFEHTELTPLYGGGIQRFFMPEGSKIQGRERGAYTSLPFKQFFLRTEAVTSACSGLSGRWDLSGCFY
ncbi:MAG: hypothetical protein HF314_03200 [Ignavibacteria bacterium]|jgi:hypothetical protein|nr:hypothetical protein [Ignavibacteria bacterium]MCU7502057.1 hypothetical protein [Ignavibacteria bacterium]MCU7515459.1 hypothetical protein [Ignavibacteria bacterium]